MIHIVGAGLAGSETAWQCANRGHQVKLYEMRPKEMTPAHQSSMCAELVCSNTFKSMDPESASGQLKNEMRAFDSLIIACAEANCIPAGQALGVNREKFAQEVTERLAAHPLIERLNQEVTELPSARPEDVWVIATGPLSSPKLLEFLEPLCGKQLHFYDAIAPMIAGESIDLSECYFANRYEPEKDDYLNIPLTKEQYTAFIDSVSNAEKMPLHDFENTTYFEACLPIEVMIERGKETLRFGPMKPVGLDDPRTGRRPWAAIQLRRENEAGTMYSMVGFQTKMKWNEQTRILRTLPGLANAEFLRLGSVHRNAFIDSPRCLIEPFQLRSRDDVYIAGQLTGVEGYTESAAIGLLVGLVVSNRLSDKSFRPPPHSTLLGALSHYVHFGTKGPFQPMNANLGLLPPGEGKTKFDRRKFQIMRACEDFSTFRAQYEDQSPYAQPKDTSFDFQSFATL